MKKILGMFLCLSMLSLSYAQTTKIVAHRGAWKNTKAPQNSIAALEEAIKGKYWGSEFDVCLTKDDILVVNHDNDFKGIDIATTDYNTLIKQKLSNGEKLPTAEEYMRAGIKQKKTHMVYEIKTNKLGVDRTLKSTEMSYNLVKSLNALEQTVFISFSYDACLLLRKLDKNVNIQYLGDNKTPQELYNDQIFGLDFHASVYKRNPDYIKEAKAKKMKTNVWTVNDKEAMEYFIHEKIDYITTDEPELLKQILKK